MPKNSSVTLPIYLQAGYPWENVAFDNPSRATYESYLIGIWQHLDSMVAGNNGDVLILGDANLPKNTFKGTDYLFPGDLGWTYRVAARDMNTSILDLGIDAVFAEMAAGTYVPRIVYVEDPSDFQGYGPILTDDQYLFLRALVESGTTAVHLQVSEGMSTGGIPTTPWVDVITDGAVRLAWADTWDVIAPAGGYTGASSDYPLYRATEYRNTDDKPFLAGLSTIGLYGWGWLIPQQLAYDDFLAEYAILVAGRDYVDLPLLTDVAPGAQRPVLGMLGIPGTEPPTSALKATRRRFV